MNQANETRGARTRIRPRRALFALACTLALALAFGAGSATPRDQIVVHGAHSGSHLRFHVDGERLVVEGYMSRSRPRGCRYIRHRMVAVCPLRKVGSIVIRMGPSGDMVEILDRLPVPLTIHLGNGSDKFIGNGERDTCYPGGAKRNRCVGGGGNDICITGERNSDCVGGPGNDYCQHGAGSDGCWGGPGRDVCRMGPGQDGCHGGPGRDLLFGGPSPDRLYGGGGRDRCDGGRGWGKSRGCEAGPRR
jgi:RTX calcium-binding nonapeptide repeat (4 copies)